VNYCVEDGGHVFAGDVYAEIEVMKMIMELRVTESGWYMSPVVSYFFNLTLLIYNTDVIFATVLFYCG